MGNTSSSSAKMNDVSSLPPEVLLHVFTFLPSSDLIRVQRISRQWRDLSKTALKARIQSSWPNPSYWPSAVEVRYGAYLVTLEHLADSVVTTLATRIQTSWSDDGSNWPSALWEKKGGYGDKLRNDP